MDRIREVRRGSMAAVNGSLSRRRQRSSGLRDSPGSISRFAHSATDSDFVLFFFSSSDFIWLLYFT